MTGRYLTHSGSTFPWIEPATTEEAIEIIRRALVLLDTEDKWLQGKIKDGNRMCIAGAIQHAMDTVRDVMDKSISFNLAPTPEFKKIFDDEDYIKPEDWNDDPDRTFADVKAYLVKLYEHHAGEEWDADAARSAVGTAEGGEDGDVRADGQSQSQDQGRLRTASAEL